MDSRRSTINLSPSSEVWIVKRYCWPEFEPQIYGSPFLPYLDFTANPREYIRSFEGYDL